MIFAANNVTEPFAPVMLLALIGILSLIVPMVIPKIAGLLDLIPDGGGDGLMATFVVGWIGLFTLFAMISG